MWGTFMRVKMKSCGTKVMNKDISGIDVNALVCNNLMYECLQVIKKLKVNDDFWHVKWDGISIDIRPFLPLGAVCLNKHDLAVRLMADCTRSKLYRPLLQQFEDIELHEQLIRLLGADSYNLISSMQFACKEHHMPACILSILLNEDIGLNYYRRLPTIFLEDIVYLSSGGTLVSRRIDMSGNGICNTQAFAYHLCCLWVCQLCPIIQQKLGAALRKLKLSEALKEECPEDSLHYKYLTKKIDSLMLFAQYNDTTIVNAKEKECALLLGLDANMEFGGTMHRAIQDVLACVPTIDTLCLGYLGFALGTCGQFDDVAKEHDEMLELYKKAEKERDEAVEVAEQSKAEVTRLKKKLDMLKESVNSLQSKLKEQKPVEDERDITIKELKQQINTLKMEKVSVEKELSSIKSENKTLKKTNKSLMSALDSLEELDEIKDSEDEQEIEEFNIEEAIEKLKGKRICVLGITELMSNINKKAEGYGLVIETYSNLDTYDVSGADFVVLFTKRCTHQLFYKAVAQLGGKEKLIYMNSSNFDLLINKLYERLILNEGC